MMELKRPKLYLGIEFTFDEFGIGWICTTKLRSSYKNLA
jgi:hypothetical protein